MLSDKQWLKTNYPRFTNTKHGFEGKVAIVNRLRINGCSSARNAMRIRKLFSIWQDHTCDTSNHTDIVTMIPLMQVWLKTQDISGPKRKISIRKKRFNSKEFYGSWVWKKVRFEVLKKYGAVCMLCNDSGDNVKICVDHIKPRDKFPELELDENNLQILCDDCNRGKSNDDYTDFRPAM